MDGSNLYDTVRFRMNSDVGFPTVVNVAAGAAVVTREICLQPLRLHKVRFVCPARVEGCVQEARERGGNS